MLWRDLVAAVRSCVVGWGALFAIIFLIERPLLHWTLPIIGASWLPTAQLALECLGLAAIGWLIGRWGNAGVLIFAVTLALFNFRLVPSIDVLWLFHLLLDCFQNARYLGSFFTSLATHMFLFASLLIGSHLSRAKLNRAREQALLRIK
jgi:hypothetical protein